MKRDDTSPVVVGLLTVLAAGAAVLLVGLQIAAWFSG